MTWIIRKINNAITSIFGYSGYFEIRSAILRAIYKKDIVALYVGEGNTKIIKGENKIVILFAITKQGHSFRIYSDDFESYSLLPRIVSVSGDIISGENAGVGAVVFKIPKINENIYAQINVEVIECRVELR